MQGEKNFCYGKMTSSQRMSKAWKPVLTKQTARLGRCQASLSNACQESEKQNMVDRKWPYLDIPCLSTESGWWLAKTNEGDSHSVQGEIKWKPAQSHLETANCTALSASPPINATTSSISNYFRIMEMCSLSAPLVKTQKAFWTRQEQTVQAGWHSNTCKTQAR